MKKKKKKTDKTKQKKNEEKIKQEHVFSSSRIYENFCFVLFIRKKKYKTTWRPDLFVIYGQDGRIFWGEVEEGVDVLSERHVCLA